MSWDSFDMEVQDGSTQGHYWLLAVSRVRYSLILDFRQTKFSSHESYAVVHRDRTCNLCGGIDCGTSGVDMHNPVSRRSEGTEHA